MSLLVDCPTDSLRLDELYVPDFEHDRGLLHNNPRSLLSAVNVLIIQGVAEKVARILTRDQVTPTLVYIDPPYLSQRDYTFAQKHPEDGRRIERVAFTDRWSGGIDAYVDALRPVFSAVHCWLTDEGSFLLHVDPRGAPYLSIACDQIFGLGERSSVKHAPGFRNELIWSYGLGGSSPRSWPKKHDNILWYTKGSAWFFDPPMVPAKSNRMKGQLKKQPDVLDIPTINNMASDRTGYPTQKPLELLQLLVCAHTQRGDVVADLFGGSGTTALAAAQSGRKAIHVDIADDSIAVARQRLVEAGFSVAVLRSGPSRTRVTPCASSIVFQRQGSMMDGVFVSEGDRAGTHVLLRDVHGLEAVVAR